MTNVLIIGGDTSKDGLALQLSKEFMPPKYSTASLHRPDIDFSEPWIPKLQEFLVKTWGGVNKVDIIIVNLYDWRTGKGHVQQDVFEQLFNLYKNTDVQLIVVGSFAHYLKVSAIHKEYERSKHYLKETVYEKGKLTHTCKLMLIEPGPLPNVAAKHPQFRDSVLSYDRVLELIKTGLDLEIKFLHFACRN